MTTTDPKTMKIAVYSVKDFETPFFDDYGKNSHALTLIEEPLTKNNTDKADGCQAIISFPTDDISAEVIEKLSDLDINYIVSRSAGVDHIDIDKAKDEGIKVANAPEYSPSAIAEHAAGIMLLLNRNLIQADEKVSRHDFRLKGLVGKELRKQTVGIIGVGSIGAKLTEILHGFGSKVLLYDIKKNEALEEKFNARYVGLDELCRHADVISIHAPLNKKTNHMIDREKFKIMKDGVMLLNLGRGAVVDTKALVEALKAGKVSKAGLDVYENEKGLFFYDHSGEQLQDETFAYLESNNNVFITTHQAFSTEDAIANMTKLAFECLEDWENGNDPESMI